jgi:hypothetical protein
VFSEDEDEDINLTDRIQLRRKCVRPNLQKHEEASVSDCSDDKDKDVNADICLICGEFGKNGELWIRCTICFLWAHTQCAV